MDDYVDDGGEEMMVDWNWEAGGGAGSNCIIWIKNIWSRMKRL
jgi:hypothetical protein